LTAAPPRSGGFGAVTVPLGAMLASQGMMALALQVVPVLAPEIARVNGVDAADVGIYSAILYAFATVSSVIGGSLVLRLGALRVCQLSLLIAAGGLCVAGFGLVGVALAAAAIGWGYGPPTPASSHVLIRVTPAHLRSLVFSLKQTGVPIGGALAGVVAPFLLLRFGLDAALLTCAVACVLIAIALQPWRAELDDDREPRRKIEWRDVLRALALVVGDPSIRLMALVSIGFSAMQISMTSFYVSYLTHAAALPGAFDGDGCRHHWPHRLGCAGRSQRATGDDACSDRRAGYGVGNPGDAALSGLAAARRARTQRRVRRGCAGLERRLARRGRALRAARPCQRGDRWCLPVHLRRGGGDAACLPCTDADERQLDDRLRRSRGAHVRLLHCAAAPGQSWNSAKVR
jgi:hypothetical protein